MASRKPPVITAPDEVEFEPRSASLLDPDRPGLDLDEADEAPVRSDQERFAPIRATGETVTIASKAPHGIVLQLYEMQEIFEPVMGGGARAVQKAFPIAGQTVTLAPATNPINEAPRVQTYGGFGLTFGVPKVLWDAWAAANSDSALLQNGILFALAGNEERAKREALNRRDVASGFEAIDPSLPINVGGRKIVQVPKEERAA